MNKKTIYRFLSIFIALTVAGIFGLCDLGLGLTPLTKVFIIFFGGIVGLQCVPAAFMFIGIVKGTFFNTEKITQPSGSLTRSGVIS
ncbi:MAG: hypothetical protein PF441_02505 [Desulfuromusa sp.]|jgi:hypothetical protein|nr:hypothetical protein [Desulfuromusa sp.]